VAAGRRSHVGRPSCQPGPGPCGRARGGHADLHIAASPAPARTSRDGRISTPFQLGAHEYQLFATDSWGGEWYPGSARPGDIVVKEHWAASSFANTDLDVQLRQHGITHVILIGLIANTCIETSGRYASELGYHVTLVRDATAAFSADAMHAAHEINGPTYAHAILTTAEVVASLTGTDAA
jgi:nicotinamidase-related amidase